MAIKVLPEHPHCASIDHVDDHRENLFPGLPRLIGQVKKP
jgi:hypothetical protein